MSFQVFELERWQSDYEHTVDTNLADSSVRGVRLGDLLEPADRERLLAAELNYPMVNGTEQLRDRIAALYPNATRDHVLVTVGGAEANQIVCQTLLGPGARVAVMEPGYRQVWGLAHGLGCEVHGFALDPDRGWRPNLDALADLAKGGLALISLVNPNNPTGSVLRSEEIDTIIRIAASTGAWILADEVYRGAERYRDDETPSLWGRYDRVIAVNSLSKAYGLSGLRLGWIVAPPDQIQPLWRRHEYAVIAAALPSMLLAEIALEPTVRNRLIARQRGLCREGWTVIEPWLAKHKSLVSVGASEASSMAFVRYSLRQSSVEVADRIRRQASVLVAPGEYLGCDHHLRITHGLGRDKVAPALEKIAEVLTEMAD